MTGLISRLVWVWPSWDKSLTDQKEPYESRLVELGWFWEERDNGRNREPHFCQCETPKVPLKDNARKCSYLNSSTSDVENQETMIATDKCHIETSYLSEHVREQHFVRKIANDPKWIENDASIILDIDEDFFGCENAANSLIRGDLSWSEIEVIDRRLQRLLCPKFIRHEELGNSFLRTLLQIFMKNCKPHRCSGMDLFTNLLNEAYDILVSEFRNHPSMFCGRNDFDVRNAWKGLADIFFQLSPEHVQRIHDLGFCLSTSPKTLFFEEGRAEFTVCHGLNPPNATIVFLHSPDKLEIAKHSQQLVTILRSILETRSLLLLTLCRSVRDGFTPRGLADFIEGEVLEILAQISDVEWEVNYDDDLLGGRMGWANRN